MTRRELPADDGALDVVDFGSDPDCVPRIETVTPASDSGARSPRPAFEPGISALAAAAAAVACAAASVIAVLVAQHRYATITAVRHQLAPVAVAVDALGCPAGSQCTVTGSPQLGMMMAVQLWNPRVEVDAGNAVLDATSTPVRSTLELHLTRSQPADVEPPVWISVVSQCVPGGSTVPGSAQLQAASVTIVVAGSRAGCSVAVTALSSVALGPLVGSLTELAHRKALQL